MSFVLSALALLPAVAQQGPEQELANGRWKTMSTAQLAAKLLPPELAKTATAHKASPPITMDGPPTQVVFYSRAYETPDGFCERKRYHVSVGGGSPIAQGTNIRFGACPPSPRTELANINPPTNVAEAKAALRWLLEAVASARGSQPLSFDVNCVAEVEPDLCAEGGRAALAKLPVGNTFIIGGWFNCQPSAMHFSIRQEELPPGAISGLVWTIALVQENGARPRLDMRWIVPPPF